MVYGCRSCKSWLGRSSTVQSCKIVSHHTGHHRTSGGAFERVSPVQLSVVTLAVNTLSKPSTNFTQIWSYLVLSCFLLCFYKQNIWNIPCQQYQYWAGQRAELQLELAQLFVGIFLLKVKVGGGSRVVIMNAGRSLALSLAVEPVL